MSIVSFLGKPRDNVVPSVLSFKIIDIDGTARNLRIRERAAESGARGYPTRESQNLDAVEHEITGEIEANGNASFSEYLENQRAYVARASDTTNETLIVRLSNEVSDAAIAFQREVKTGKGDLYALRRKVRDTERELEEFRAKHSLTRPAWNQDAGLSHWLVLTFILAIEAVLNGYFLARGNSFGFAGGVFEALLIAAMNISIGWVVGRIVISQIFHRWFVHKVFGVVVTIAYIAVAIGFNLGVAHYRLAMSGDPFDASATAYKTLRQTPLLLNDLQSWALFGMGLAFSFFAAQKGLSYDDPYPGYGKRMRLSHDALAEYTTLKDELLSDIDQIKDRAEEQMDDAIRSIGSRGSEYDHILSKSQSLKASLESHLFHLQQAGRTLLQIYRDENRNHRPGGALAPSRFDESWRYTPPDISGVQIVRPLTEQAQEDARKALGEAPGLRNKLHAAWSAAVAEYQQIDDIVDRDNGK